MPSVPWEFLVSGSDRGAAELSSRDGDCTHEIATVESRHAVRVAYEAIWHTR